VDALVATARSLRAEGAEEFVFGFLDPDGTPDLVTAERLIAELDGCLWTFHRAIDWAADRDALRKQLAELPGLDTFLTAGSPAGVEAGLPTLLSEAAATDRGDPGYGQRIMVGGGLRLEHLPVLRAAGLTAFHIGGAARPAGWRGPVAVTSVREWRTALDG
jgi:copper homeostasis protein